MIAIRFEIDLKEPLLATALEGDPNSAVSLPYIPGSLIRGALVSRYLQSYHPTNDLAADAQARRLFFNGTTRYLNAYLADDNGKRTLPTPFSWYKEKGAGERFTAYDMSVEEPDEEDLAHPVRLAESFCYSESGTASLYEPHKQVTLHTQRDRKMGRATRESGAVFQYEALAPDQTFVGFVLCVDAGTANTVEQLLKADNRLLLGGSRSAGYGLVEIRKIQRETEWTESPLTGQDGIKVGEAFTLILLSDAILRDGNGHYTGFLTPEILQGYLGVPLTPLDECTFARSGIVGGFNRKWGLPLPQVPVACAGSVYTFRAEGDVPKGKLSALFEADIGERRVDGFGRITLHWNDREAMQIAPPISKRPGPSPLREESESATLARRMATRILRRRVDAQLTERINQLTINGDIRNTQLSRIRTLVRSAWLNGNVQPILDYLNGLKDTASKQFESARVDGTTLDRWLGDVLEESPDKVWERLCRSSLRQENLLAVGDIRAEWDESLAREYALRLIDGVLSCTLEQRRAGK